MKSDKEIQDIYTAFYRKTLPQLNKTYYLETMVIRKVNMFNKKGVYRQTIDEYEKCQSLVGSVFESIYSSRDEYDEVLNNSSKLLKGEPALANETPIGHHVEQFFYAINMAVISRMAFYQGAMDQNQSDQAHNAAIELMNEKITRINNMFGIR